MGAVETYLSQIGAFTGDEMKSALYQLLVARYFWTVWDSESSQKLASSIVNLLFCEPGSGEIARYMAEHRPQIESKARELAKDDRLCGALTCAVYNFSYGRYVDSGGRVGSFFPPFIGFARAIQEVASGRERHEFLDSFIAKIGSRGAEPLLRLLVLGLYRPLPHTPDSKLMRDQVGIFVQHTMSGRVTNLEALEVAEASGRIAAALVAFSAKQTGTAQGITRIAFEETAPMLHAGFEPKSSTLLQQVEPSATEFESDELFPPALRSATALICYYVHMLVNERINDPENRYSNRLQSSLARFCAGRFGFSPDPAAVFNTINGIIPGFFHKSWINKESPGKDDCLGKILTDLSDVGSSHRYAFLVGSAKQPLGCAAPVMGILMRVQEVFSNVGQEEQVGAR